MPAILHHPETRRAFLRTATLGGAALVLAGCRTPGGSASKGPDAYRVALLSDTHVPGDRQNGHRGFNPWDNLKNVVPQVLATRPEAVVLCGDAARLEGKPEDYQEVRSLLDPLAAVAPVCIALGNHDDRANFLKAFPNPPGLPVKLAGKHVTVLEHPVVRLIVLDSLLYVNQVAGLLGQAQRAWLARELPRLADRPAVLFVHHTLGPGDGELLDADKLFDLVRPHRHVKAVFYGHSHVWELTRRDRLHQVNLPATGYNFSDTQPVGWVDARFDQTGVALTLRAFGGNRSGDGKTTHLAWG